MKDMEKLTFEKAMTRLEEIVRALEKGDAPLETSLTIFEEGAALIKHCNAMLDNAEQKVTMLTKNQSGAEETEFRSQ